MSSSGERVRERPHPPVWFVGKREVAVCFSIQFWHWKRWNAGFTEACLCVFYLAALQVLLTVRQRSTWPWWWGRGRYPGVLRTLRCVTHSSLPCLPIGCRLRILPATLRVPSFHQWLTDAERSVPPVRRSWRWTRSWSCSAAASEAPSCCLSSPPPGKLSVVRNRSIHPPGSWFKQKWLPTFTVTTALRVSVIITQNWIDTS